MGLHCVSLPGLYLVGEHMEFHDTKLPFNLAAITMQPKRAWCYHFVSWCIPSSPRLDAPTTLTCHQTTLALQSHPSQVIHTSQPTASGFFREGLIHPTVVSLLPPSKCWSCPNGYSYIFFFPEQGIQGFTNFLFCSFKIGLPGLQGHDETSNITHHFVFLFFCCVQAFCLVTL